MDLALSLDVLAACTAFAFAARSCLGRFEFGKSDEPFVPSLTAQSRLNTGRAIPVFVV